jgi:hypothetical protein
LKRFYNLLESNERIPRISQYYELYTLFAPVYFGLELPLIKIMNEWTKEKKSYLEYVEDKEDKNEYKKQNQEININNLNFKKIINSSLICSKSSYIKSKSNNTKKTLDLTKYDNIDSFFLKDNLNLSLMEINEKKNTERKNIKNISLSKIMEDLSRNYSIYISNNYNIKNNEEKNKIINNIIKDKKKEENKNDKNMFPSDKMFVSFINLYKNRKKYNCQKKYKKKYFTTNNNSTSKIKKSQLNEIIKLKKIKNNIKAKCNFPLNELKDNNIKKKFKLQNDLQFVLNTFTGNKGSKEKINKNNNYRKNTLTNANTWINITSFNNSANNSLSKLKKRKKKNKKIKKLYLRNLNIIIPSYKYSGPKMCTPSSNTLESNDNSGGNNISKIKCNLTRLLSHKYGKIKNSFLNASNINQKNFINFNYNGKNQNIYCPFSNKINRLIKEKKIITSTNSFSNNKNNISKNEKKNSKKVNDNKKKQNNLILLNKKQNNRHLIRNLVLTQFHSKKEINNSSTNSKNSKQKYNCNNNSYSSAHQKIISSITKRTFSGKINNKLNNSLTNKPYKKELNKINLNFNLNINFNIDVNKIRQKRYLNANQNNLRFLTQRNQVIKGSILNKISDNKNRYKELSHKKNIANDLTKKVKNECNFGLKKNIKKLK